MSESSIREDLLSSGDRPIPQPLQCFPDLKKKNNNSAAPFYLISATNCWLYYFQYMLIKKKKKKKTPKNWRVYLVSFETCGRPVMNSNNPLSSRFKRWNRAHFSITFTVLLIVVMCSSFYFIHFVQPATEIYQQVTKFRSRNDFTC